MFLDINTQFDNFYISRRAPVFDFVSASASVSATASASVSLSASAGRGSGSFNRIESAARIV